MDEREKERETEGGWGASDGREFRKTGRERGMDEEGGREGREGRGRWEVKCHLILFCVCTQN